MAPGFARLTGPVTLASRVAQSRVMFGPHETNLGQPGAGPARQPGGRGFSPRHVAYYERRAAGGAGLIVTEAASVHASDWPYERAPLAATAAGGWRQIAAACQPHGTLVLAGLGHTGLQGSSAYSQTALWGPSGVPDPVTREVPMEMGNAEIGALTAGFAAAAGLAVAAGADGVEIDAGARSLLRQFHSGLTNHRADGYGRDRLRLTREVLAAVRGVIGPRHILGLRLSCDELAPWAGVTPQDGAAQARELSRWLDLLVVVRGGPYSTASYRPDGHTAPVFNAALARRVRDALDDAVPVVLQGSVADPGDARDALDSGGCDLVEMTRAQIADAGLVGKLRQDRPGQVRPCLLCNQACQVRDPRNPLVSCVADPRSGHEIEDQPEQGRDPRPRDVLVVGGGPAWKQPGCSRPGATGSGSPSRASGPAGRCAPRPGRPAGNGWPCSRTGWTPSAGGWACASTPAPRSARPIWPRPGPAGPRCCSPPDPAPVSCARQPPGTRCRPWTRSPCWLAVWPAFRTARSWCTTRLAARPESRWPSGWRRAAAP